MRKPNPLRDAPNERSPIPLVVAICGLIAAVTSFWMRNENLSADVFGCGVITAGYCIFYWIINPTQGLH